MKGKAWFWLWCLTTLFSLKNLYSKLGFRNLEVFQFQYHRNFRIEKNSNEAFSLRLPESISFRKHP